MKRAVIFDLDGVLVHTDELHFSAWKGLTDALGISFRPSDYDAIRGLSRMDSLEHILSLSPRDFRPEEKAALAEQKNRVYLALVERMTPADVTADAREALGALRGRGILLAVGSSSRNARRILARTELTGSFDAIVDGSDITRAKPDPEVFLQAAERLGVEPGEALVVEDAAAGLQAARAGGFMAAAFGGDAILSPLADHRLSRLTDLLSLV